MGQTVSYNHQTPKTTHKFGGYKSQDKPRPGYYKTPSEVFYRGKTITEATPSNFEKLGTGWAKDCTNVYFQGEIVSGADHKSFKVLNKFGHDKKGKWYRGKLVR